MATESLADKLLPNNLIACIEGVLQKNGTRRARSATPRAAEEQKTKICGTRTLKARRYEILAAYAQLWQAGFRIQRMDSLGERHIEVLAALWDKEGVSAATIQNRLCHLRTFCNWIGKPGMVKYPTDYLPKERVQRSTVAKEDKSWEGNELDVAALLGVAKEMDERFGVLLALQREFGMRLKESLEFLPGVNWREGFIEIIEGTKGGRPRVMPITRPAQLDVLSAARRLSEEWGTGGKVRWPRMTLQQARNRFYTLARQLGICKDGLGVTAHGLRHEFAQRQYLEKTGRPMPIRGGRAADIDHATHQAAFMSVSRDLGHGRVDVTCAYGGSFGHHLRSTIVPVTLRFA